MIDRLLPHDVESEAATLGAILLEKSCMDEARTVIKRADFFYLQQNQVIWSELCAMAEDGIALDVVTLHGRLRNSGRLESAGNVDYLQRLPDHCPSPATLDYYVEIVREKYLRRRMIQAFTKKAQQLYESTEPADTLLEQTHAELESLYETDTGLVTSREASRMMIDDLQRRYELNGAMSGIPTPFQRFNDMTDGLQFGEQSIIASRPSIGKTAIGLNIFYHAAVLHKIPSLFVTLEMRIQPLMRRMAAYAESIGMRELRRGTFEEGDFKKLTMFQTRAGKALFWMLEAIGGMEIGKLAAKIRQACRLHGIKLVVIDYLQMIKPDRREEKRTYEVGGVSTALKGVAAQTEAAFLTLAQVNRDSERNKKPGPPRLCDLSDSKQIEADGDMIALLHRDRNNTDGEAFLLIAKQRDGDTGPCKLKFDGAHCRFEDAICT